MKPVSRTLAACLLLGALALPGIATAQTSTCADPYEDTSDTAVLVPGSGVERGFCAPDRDGGRDVDFFAVPTTEGHRYRVHLVERGSGFADARLHIEDSYDRAGSVSFTADTAYSLSSRPLLGDSLTFTAEALRSTAGQVPVTGEDLGYTILVTDLDAATTPSVAAIQIAPGVVRGGAPATATITLDSAAPAGGATITLSSSDRRVQPPATITVPAGAVQVAASLTTARTRRDTSVTVTAEYGSSSVNGVLLVTR